MTDDTEPTGPHIWLLTAGEYSAYHVVGAFATEAEAIAVRDALGGTYTYDGEFEVEHVPVLSGITVERLWSELTCSMTIFWHGRIIGEREGDPIDRCVVHGIGDDAFGPTLSERPAPVTIKVEPTESGYTLGVHLRVHGTDIERVRKVFSEQRAILVAEPAIATINAWVRSEWLPRWTFGRAENAALAPHLAEALRAAGKGHLVATCVDEGS